MKFRQGDTVFVSIKRYQGLYRFGTYFNSGEIPQLKACCSVYPLDNKETLSPMTYYVELAYVVKATKTHRILYGNNK